MASTVTLWNRWRHNNINDDDDDEPGTPKQKIASRASRGRTRTQSVESVQSMPNSEDWVCRKAQRAATGEMHTTINSNCKNNEHQLMQWLETQCPGDCFPKILAFCGPQQTAALSRTSKHWNDTIRAESTWRVLCEELYKWKPGDKKPKSWFDLYRNSPCVPIDYSSIPKALQMAATTDQQPQSRRRSPQHPQQVRSIRVLLRPGKYVLKQAIQVHAAPGVVVSLETVQLPKNRYQGGHAAFVQDNHHADRMHNTCGILTEQPLPLGPSLPRAPRVPRMAEVQQQQRQQVTAANNNNSNKPSFRNLFGCNRQPAQDPEASVTDDLTDFEDSWLHGTDFTSNHQQTAEHATLLVRSRRQNEPAFHVQQGLLRLQHVEIQHNSHGLDIWNGNAAVQIQPPQQQQQFLDEQSLLTSARPTAVLEHCLITSKSGRGIVNIDGGKLVARHCAVVDCAATGIYIGGPGSSAHLESVDVLRNGVGRHANNGRPGGRGIARGHSGIYLEQGLARIHNCNISQNTLSGVSVVSPDHAILHLQNSSLTANGTHQLELPPNGTASRQRSNISADNTLSSNDHAGDAVEPPPLRSGWVIQAPPFLPPPLLHVPQPARAW